MTREEHLAWCKQRALEYLPKDPPSALTSIASDLSKHPETKDHAGIQMGMMLLLGGHLSHPEEMRNFINGFN